MTSLTSMSPGDEAKKAAGIEAAGFVSPGMRLGLGTGSTVAFFVDALGRRFGAGELPGIVGVPTSLRTQSAASALGIPLTTLEGAGTLDLTVDGADEVDPQLNLIKGLGGALLREKMIAQATRHFIIIADEGKLVEGLGTRSPLPVEVVPFGWKSHVPFLRELGAEPALRVGTEGKAYETDNGNLIIDCRFPDGIRDPAALEGALAGRAGVVESGLFLDLAHRVLVGSGEGVRMITREGELPQ